MSERILFPAVQKLAEAIGPLPDYELEQPYRWRAHAEGVRFALLGTYHELRELAVELGARRAAEGPPYSTAQRALAPYHTAYRDLQAVLTGVEDEHYRRSPGVGEWPLERVLVHIIAAERAFYGLVHYGAVRQRVPAGAEPPTARFPDEQLDEMVDAGVRGGSFAEAQTGGPQALRTYWRRLHERILEEFADLTDRELEGPSLWWEGEELPLLYRLHRFDAHLRQHTAQAEKTLAVIGHSPTEAQRLLRFVYGALADVERDLIGAPALGRSERERLAAVVADRAEAISGRVARARSLGEAVRAGDLARVESVLDEDPLLAGAVGPDGLSLVLAAAYRRHGDVAERLAAEATPLSIHEAAALGRLERVQEWVARWDGFLSLVNRDGFMPLHLACFFGHEPVALWLLEQGADVDAVAENDQQIRPLHAAAAGGTGSIVRALLEAGAEANARQAGAFTALHGAAQQGDLEMVRLLLEHGGDPALKDDKGRTPADLARAAGHEEVAALLEG